MAPSETLLMLVDCASGAIVGFYGAITTPLGETVGEVVLRPGSELEVMFIRIDTGDSSSDLVPGITVTLPAGADSLSVTSGPAVPGDYVFIALVSDIAGNQSADGIDVTIPVNPGVVRPRRPGTVWISGGAMRPKDSRSSGISEAVVNAQISPAAGAACLAEAAGVCPLQRCSVTPRIRRLAPSRC